MRRALTAALLFLVAAPGADAQFDNGQTSEFGTISLPPFPQYAGEPMELVARIVLHDGLARSEAHRIHFSWTMVSGGMAVTFTDLTSADGTAISLAADERGPDKLRVQVAPQALPPPGEAILMHALVVPSETGLYHLGASVIAFGESFEKAQNADGSSAELYGYAQVRNTRVEDGVLRPPFVGSGNANALLFFAGALVFGIVSAGRWALRRWT